MGKKIIHGNDRHPGDTDVLEGVAHRDWFGHAVAGKDDRPIAFAETNYLAAPAMENSSSLSGGKLCY